MSKQRQKNKSNNINVLDATENVLMEFKGARDKKRKAWEVFCEKRGVLLNLLEKMKKEI